MNKETHKAAGGLAGAIAISITGAPLYLWPFALVAGSVAGMLADIDHGGSGANRVVPMSGMVVGGLFQHRTFTHSILAVVIFAALLKMVPGLPQPIWLAAVAGYLSHPLIDTFNPKGVQWFFPFGPKIAIPLVCFQTGSKLETKILKPVLWCATTCTLVSLLFGHSVIERWVLT